MSSDGAVDEVVELCSELIRIDTSNTGELETTVGEREAADYVATKLAEVGLEFERVESGRRGGTTSSVGCAVRITGVAPCSSMVTSMSCPPIPASGRCIRSRVRCRTAMCGVGARST